MSSGGRPYIGQRIARVEDARLLAGNGQYTADLEFDNLAHMAVVRSDHPCARVGAIDVAAARAMPGVLGIWTGADALADGLGGIPWEDRPPSHYTLHATERPPIGADSVAVRQPVLAHDLVRYQGEAIAIVVAETQEQARDAAERVIVEYFPRPAVTDKHAAVRHGAPLVWQQFAGNIAFEHECGDVPATDAAFAAAAHTVNLDLDVPRLIQNPIEPRAYVGHWDTVTARYTLYAAAGKPQAVGRTIAREVFRIAPEKIRVVTRDVGGGFGAKNILYPEEVLVLWVARKIGRPVRWIATRSEGFLTDTQARDQSASMSLALDAAGHILALRATVVSNLGAYLGPKGAIPPLIVSKILTGTYAIPSVSLQLRACYTHTPPTGPYRGAGTPEAIFMIERAMDKAAAALGIAPAVLRRRNLIPAAAMPYTTSLGVAFDSGDLVAAMDLAETEADVAGFEQRRIKSAALGKLRGLGYATMIEWAGVGIAEASSIACLPDGSVHAYAGTMSNGQSHETVYAQLVADTLGIGIERVHIHQGDSDETPDGVGTGASRSMTVAGSAMLRATHALIEAGRSVASDMLEVASADLEFADGRYRITGTDRELTLEQAAAHAVADNPGEPRGLRVSSRYEPAESTCPNGCHIAEVEIDPDTGVATVMRYTIVQDVGRALNPMVVEAQLMGGVTQGIGQALLERTVFDTESGQLLSGSFMDYAMPRADDLPSFTVRLLEVPCPHTPYGMKSCGEIGATGGPATTFNAVMNALAPMGIGDLSVPATPQVILAALRSAREG